MKKCIIFCAGGFDRLAQSIGPEDVLIAADGGLRHTQSLGLTPDIILGDFDSLGHIPAGAEVHPVEKDETDAILAIQKGLSLGCDTFYLYGSLDGPRLDHTIANLQSLVYLARRGAVGYLIGERQIIRSLQGETLEFPAGFRGILSLFCLGGDARGVSLRGTKYVLEKGTLTAGFPLGVSNQFTGKQAAVSVEEGTLLLLWDRENGLA